MNTKNIVIVLGIIVIVGIGWYIYSLQKTNPLNVTSNEEINTTSGMRVEDNAIVVQDQKPGNSLLVSQVYFTSPGYVVMHDMSNKIIGASAILPAGTSNNVTIQLSQASKDGDMFNAMLHNEKNNNTTFEDNIDMPVASKLGGFIMSMFNISSQAGGNTQTSI